MPKGQPVQDVAILYKEDEATRSEGDESHYETDANWSPFQVVEGGKQTFQALTPAIMCEAHILIAAKGFEPVSLKLDEKLQRGQPIIKEVRMKATPPVEFILTTAAGAPAKGATLETLKSRELRAIPSYNGGTQLDPFLNLNVKSDTEGILRFPLPAFSHWTTYRIEHSSGYVNVRGKDLPKTDAERSGAARKIRLIPYASIKGLYRPQINTNEFLEMYRLTSNRKSVDGPAQLFTLDQDGGFEVAKLLEP